MSGNCLLSISHRLERRRVLITTLVDAVAKPIRPNVINHLHPLIYSSGMLPNQAELKERIESVAKLNGMVEGAADGIQDVLGVALDVSIESTLASGSQSMLMGLSDCSLTLIACSTLRSN